MNDHQHFFEGKLSNLLYFFFEQNVVLCKLMFHYFVGFEGLFYINSSISKEELESFTIY